MTSLPPSVRSRVSSGLTAAAAVGRLELQVCRSCGAVQYPPREACHRCLSSALDWRLQSGGAELLAETTLLHSHDEFFRARLPIRLGLVRLDSGPTAVVFLDDGVDVGVGAAPARVRVGVRLDRAGQGVLVAFGEGARVGGSTESGSINGESPKSAHLREMTCDPRGRGVLVTDGCSALGVALIRALVDAGAQVVWAGCGPAPSLASAPADLLRELGAVQFVSLDMTRDESVLGLATQIGIRVDVLIDNAEGEMDANYPGLSRLARAFGPAMRTRAAAAPVGSPAMAWINLLTTFSTSNSPACSFYQSLRAEMRPSGIRTINVFPAPVENERNRGLPPPNIPPGSVARAIVHALQEGIEDLYPV